MDSRKIDFLVIGSGIAGLSYALKVCDHGKVMILTKSNEDETNTKYAQGGIAAVFYDNDSFEKHINDTLVAGSGICDEDVVKMVVTESTQRDSPKRFPKRIARHPTASKSTPKPPAQKIARFASPHRSSSK